MSESNPRRNVRPIQPPPSPERLTSQLVPIDRSHTLAINELSEHTPQSSHPVPVTRKAGDGDRHTHQHIHIHVEQAQPQYSYYSWTWISTHSGSSRNFTPSVSPSLPASESVLASVIVRFAQLVVWLGAIVAGVWFTGKFRGWF